MSEELLAWAKRHGYHVGWGSLEAAALACDDVRSRHAAGEFDADFFDQNLGWFRPPEPRRSGDERVLVVVMPRPAHAVVFDLGDHTRTVVIPPTYVRYTALFDEVALSLQTHALPPGSRMTRVNAPLKALAARLGMVQYGRNNLVYDAEFGASIQLFGYITDAPFPMPDGWRPSAPELLAECGFCTACRDACPTGAIGDDRVLLHGERCLTWWNENPGEWPAWLPSDAHHCLVGCLVCQGVCPANTGPEVIDTGVIFDPEETATILADPQDQSGPIWGAIRNKLDRIGRLNEESVLGRNLRVLLASKPGNLPGTFGRLSQPIWRQEGFP